jgi:hypothetical protein
MPGRIRGLALSIPIALIAAAIAMALIGFPAFGAPATPRAHASSSGKAYSTTITYVETNHGHLRGSTTTGIQGHGTFSAKLSAHAALEAAVIAAATGIPLPQIVKGGSYTIEHSDNGTGVAVVTFKARGLGKLCVGYTAKAGKFVPGDAWIPVSGTLKALGGTGTAATWSGSVTFNQTALSGTSVQKYGFSGQARGSVGKARGMSATCKHVAAIKG